MVAGKVEQDDGKEPIPDIDQQDARVNYWENEVIRFTGRIPVGFGQAVVWTSRGTLTPTLWAAEKSLARFGLLAKDCTLSPRQKILLKMASHNCHEQFHIPKDSSMDDLDTLSALCNPGPLATPKHLHH